ncbi:MAG TPA: nucleotidyltransferase domain-containing protein [Niabella sp.]
MRTIIKRNLKEIGNRKNIELLYACETGSWAWGFPSPDSDYDVRFIYRHERNWYLSLSAKKDSIEFMKDDLDITGWDLKKCLLLLKKSNVPLIERFQSPIVYFAAPGFKQEFRQLIATYYSPIAVFFHHYSLALKFREQVQPGKPFKLKSLFYMLRSLLSCNWVLLDDQVVPMELGKLLRYNNAAVNKTIMELVALKATKPESYYHKGPPMLFKWIEKQFEHLAAASGEQLKVNNTGMELLNHYFINKLNETT